jgi:tight adherence protein C
VISAAPAVALLACMALAVRGWMLIVDRGPAERFITVAETGLVTERVSLLGRLLDALSVRLSGRALGLLGERRVDRIRHRMEAAGRPGGLTIEGYAGRKAAWTVLMGGAGFLFFLARGNVLVLLITSAAGFMWMDFWLIGLARRRQARIERDLPDFLDVVAVTIGAGVGFRAALGRVADSLGGPLGEEVTTTLRQIDLGAGRRTAFEDLRARNDSASVARFVTSLLQAEELGTPLAESIVELAGEMRRASAQDARRKAARAAPRVSLIVTTVIVPGALILIVAGLFIGSGLDLGTFRG